MPKIQMLLLPWLALLASCAAPVPVAVDCPQPPPPPAVLTSPVTTGPSLAERMELSLKKFEEALTKAARQP